VSPLFSFFFFFFFCLSLLLFNSSNPDCHNCQSLRALRDYGAAFYSLPLFLSLFFPSFWLSMGWVFLLVLQSAVHNYGTTLNLVGTRRSSPLLPSLPFFFFPLDSPAFVVTVRSGYKVSECDHFSFLVLS